MGLWDTYKEAKGNPYLTINTPRATSPIDKNNGDDKIDWDAVEENALNNIQPLLLSRFQKQNINNSGLTNGVRGFYNFAQNSLKGTPYGKAMQIAGIGGDVLTMMGLSNDQQTTKDKFFSGIPIIGNLINIGSKKTRDYSYNRQLVSEIGAAYGGLVSDMKKAESLAGKSYSILSNGDRRANNRFIGNVAEDEKKAEDIMQEASDRRGMVSDLNYLRYQNDLNGNSNLRYARVVKLGGILQRVKQINFHKQGGVQWKPTITYDWKPVITFQNGGKTQKDNISLESPKIEETNQKNIIPEGALHAHKHHMENAEDFTKKGIPVIDNDGEQQAEIERDEIIFTLEVTKALEDLYSKYFNENSAQKDKDEAAIEAGKLLVKEILFNTDDRTNLISKCEKGGVLNDTK